MRLPEHPQGRLPAERRCVPVQELHGRARERHHEPQGHQDGAPPGLRVHADQELPRDQGRVPHTRGPVPVPGPHTRDPNVQGADAGQDQGREPAQDDNRKLQKTPPQVL